MAPEPPYELRSRWRRPENSLEEPYLGSLSFSRIFPQARGWTARFPAEVLDRFVNLHLRPESGLRMHMSSRSALPDIPMYLDATIVELASGRCRDEVSLLGVCLDVRVRRSFFDNPGPVITAARLYGRGLPALCEAHGADRALELLGDDPAFFEALFHAAPYSAADTFGKLERRYFLQNAAAEWKQAVVVLAGCVESQLADAVQLVTGSRFLGQKPQLVTDVVTALRNDSYPVLLWAEWSRTQFTEEQIVFLADLAASQQPRRADHPIYGQLSPFSAAIARLYISAPAVAFERMRNLVLKTSPAIAVALLAAEGTAAFDLNDSAGRTLRMADSYLRDKVDNPAGAVHIAGNVPIALLNASPEVPLFLARRTPCADDQAAALRELSVATYHRYRPVIGAAFRLVYDPTVILRTLDALPRKFDAEYLKQIVVLCGPGAGPVLRHLVPSADPDELLSQARRYGPVLGELAERFPGTFLFEKEAELRPFLKALDPYVQGALFEVVRHIPPADIMDPRLLDCAAFYRGALGNEYAGRAEQWKKERSGSDRPFTIESFLSFERGVRPLMEYLQQVLGVRSFYRYLERRNEISSFPDLVESARVLDRGRSQPLPLLAVLTAEFDPNNAFKRIAESPGIAEAAPHHSRVFLEAASTWEAALLLRSVAGIRGTDHEGNPLHPIESTVIAAHATRRFLRWSRGPGFESSECVLSIHDDGVWEELGRYMANFLVLDSCNAAQGGFGELNILTRAVENARHLTVTASRDTCFGVDRIHVDGNGRKVFRLNTDRQEIVWHGGADREIW